MKVKTKHGIYEIGELKLGKEFTDSIGKAINGALEIQKNSIMVSVWANVDKGSQIHFSYGEGDNEFILVDLFQAIKEGFDVSDPEGLEHLSTELREIADYIEGKIKEKD